MILKKGETTLELSFNQRFRLDEYILSNYGKSNPDITLELSEEEMKTLFLSPTTTVYGAKVKLLE